MTAPEGKDLGPDSLQGTTRARKPQGSESQDMAPGRADPASLPGCLECLTLWGLRGRASGSMSSRWPSETRGCPPGARSAHAGAGTVEPRDRSLDDPAVDSQPAGVSLSSPGDPGADVALPERLAMRTRVVGPVREDLLGTATWLARRACHRQGRRRPARPSGSRRAHLRR